MPSARAIRKEAREEGESYEHEREEYERGQEPLKKRKKEVKGEGAKGSRRLDRPGRKAGGRSGKWISGAIHHPGALHRQLGVPEGEKFPLQNWKRRRIRRIRHYVAAQIWQRRSPDFIKIEIPVPSDW